MRKDRVVLLKELEESLKSDSRPFSLEVLDKITKAHDDKVLELIETGKAKEIVLKYLGRIKLKNYNGTNNTSGRDANILSRSENN